MATLPPRPSSTEPPAADTTRAALVRAALTLFGSQGFEGTSTREVAALANANIGSIAYHFGNKEGLRIAVADFIAETMQTIALQAIGGLDGPAAKPAGAEAARAQLLTGLERLIAFIIARPEAGDIVRFVLREMSQPSAALDRIYNGVFEPAHRRLCLIWEEATGEPAESERTRLTVFTLLGQVLYFRIGAEVVKRRMGWETFGEAEAGKVADVVRDNLLAILSSRIGSDA